MNNEQKQTEKYYTHLVDVLGDFLENSTKWADCCEPLNQSGYPLYDQFVNADGSLVFEFALAGFPKTSLNVVTHVSTRTLTVECSCKHDEKLVNRRIARRSFVKKFSVDTVRFDLSGVTSTFVDGLLTVKVPLHKTPPTNEQVKVKIF